MNSFIFQDLNTRYKKRENLNKVKFFKQVCIYAFNYNELKFLGLFTRKGFLEKIEDIELMRYLELTSKK